MFKVSESAGNMSLWIRACVATFDALLIVDPKRQRLLIAEANLL
jgi:dynein heavy chain